MTGTDIVPAGEGPKPRKVGGSKKGEVLTLPGPSHKPVTLDEAMSRTARQMMQYLPDGAELVVDADGALRVYDPSLGDNSRGDVSRQELAYDAMVRERAKAKMGNSLSRAAFNRGYTSCMADFAHLLVDFDRQVLEKATDPDATDVDRQIAVRVSKDIKDRLGGKAVTTLENETGAEETFVQQMMRKRGGGE